MSMFRTTTISLCASSVKTAPFVTSAHVCAYPFVKKRRAFAQRSGVFRRPSLSGSSPMHWRIVRHADAIFATLSSSVSALGEDSATAGDAAGRFSFSFPSAALEATSSPPARFLLLRSFLSRRSLLRFSFRSFLVAADLVLPRAFSVEERDESSDEDDTELTAATVDEDTDATSSSIVSTYTRLLKLAHLRMCVSRTATQFLKCKVFLRLRRLFGAT
mmetsp:Transcript_49839/g.92210  ORF Transcript_49839/g.92210 Transcript_49839/m.92210 type:complete len:217 (+) Transcript_49839:266-916(+)